MTLAALFPGLTETLRALWITAAVLAILVAGSCWAAHHERDVGRADIRDSVAAAHLVTLSHHADSLGAHAESLRGPILAAVAALHQVQPRTIAALEAAPRVHVVTPLHAADAPADTALAIVLIANDSTRWLVPHRIATELAGYDSLLYQVAVPLLKRQRAVVDSLVLYAGAEHAARLASDSARAAALVRIRTLEDARPGFWTKALHVTRDVAALGLVAYGSYRVGRAIR